VVPIVQLVRNAATFELMMRLMLLSTSMTVCANASSTPESTRTNFLIVALMTCSPDHSSKAKRSQILQEGCSMVVA
jgi:hypothetical protein